jgi:hypothetical protein
MHVYSPSGFDAAPSPCYVPDRQLLCAYYFVFYYALVLIPSQGAPSNTRLLSSCSAGFDCWRGVHEKGWTRVQK